MADQGEGIDFLCVPIELQCGVRKEWRWLGVETGKLALTRDLPPVDRPELGRTGLPREWNRACRRYPDC